MFLLACLLQKVPSHLGQPRGGTAGHGPPAYATSQCTVLHCHMGGYQLSMCQKCTGAGASFHAGSCNVCTWRVCHYLITLETCPHLSGMLFLMCFEFL